MGSREGAADRSKGTTIEVTISGCSGGVAATGLAVVMAEVSASESRTGRRRMGEIRFLS